MVEYYTACTEFGICAVRDSGAADGDAPVDVSAPSLCKVTTNGKVSHLPCVLLLLGGYACIAYITYETEDFYTYGFLDSSKFSAGALAGHLIGIGAGCGGFFVLVRLAIYARLLLVEKKLGKHGKRSKRDSEVATRPWIEMEVQERRVEESKE